MKVILTFDDGYEEDYTTTYPILKERGIVATSYIVTNDIGKKGYLSWDQIKIMAKDGWDFQCHTHNHRDIRELKEKQIIEELKMVENEFLRHSMPIPKHTTYPYGKENNKARNAISQRRISARGGNKGKGGDYDIISYGLHGNKDVFKLIDNNKTLFIHTHDVSDNHRGFGISVNYFKKIIDYLIKKNANFLTISQYYK